MIRTRFSALNSALVDLQRQVLYANEQWATYNSRGPTRHLSFEGLKTTLSECESCAQDFLVELSFLMPMIEGTGILPVQQIRLDEALAHGRHTDLSMDSAAQSTDME